MMVVRQRAGLILSLLAAFGLIVLVVRVSTPAIFAGTPRLADRFAPNDPATVFADVLTEYGTRPRHLSGDIWHRVQDAAVREPLASVPFVAAAVRASSMGQDSRATALLEEARRRDPRERLGRVLLLERYAREGRVSDMIVELATLDRIAAQARPLLINVLAAAAVNPETADAVFRVVHDPVTLNGLLTKLVANGTPTDSIIRLSANLPPTTDADSLTWRRLLLDRLVDAGSYQGAYRLWQAFGRTDARPRTLVYNGNFDRLTTLPPFNWKLAAGDVGAAEIEANHVLSVEYFGRQSGDLAAQLLQLPAGNYELHVDIEGRVTDDATKLILGVHCAAPGKAEADGTALLDTVLVNPTAQKRRLTGRFTVPTGGCSAQWLALRGIAAEFPTSQSIELSHVDLKALG